MRNVTTGMSTIIDSDASLMTDFKEFEQVVKHGRDEKRER